MRNLLKHLSAILIILFLAACGGGGGGGDNDENNTAQKPSGNWSSNISYSNNNKTVEILLDSYCTQFHNDTPAEGQQFDETTITTDPFFKAYSRYYNAMFSLCANSYGFNLLDEQREAEKEYHDSSNRIWHELASIQYIDSSINDTIIEIANEEEMPDDRKIFENLFQQALWIKTDDIKPDDDFENDDNTLGRILSFYVKNDSDADKIFAKLNELEGNLNNYEQILYENASALVNLIEQYRDFSGFDSITEFSTGGAVDLITAQQQGLIDYRIEGVGKFSGQSLKLTIDTLTDDAVNISIPPGLISSSSGSSSASYKSSAAYTPLPENDSEYIRSLASHFNDEGKPRPQVYTLSSGGSVQSMMSVSSIDNVSLNDPSSTQSSSYSTNHYTSGGNNFTGSDIAGATCEDTSTGSQFIIDKFTNSDSSISIEAQEAIINEVKAIVAAGGVPSSGTPGVGKVGLSDGRVAIYCYGKFIGEVQVDQYGVNYGVFDADTAVYIYEKLGQNPDLLTDIKKAIPFQLNRLKSFGVTDEDWLHNAENTIAKVFADTGISFAKFIDIIKTKKGDRPDPKTYLDQNYIDKHLSQFEEGSFIMTLETYELYLMGDSSFGFDDNTQYIIPKEVMDSVVWNANGDLSIYEAALGYKEGHLKSKSGILVRIDVKNLKDLNLRMASGNELGANELYTPGGCTSGGVPEAVIDRIPNTEKYVRNITMIPLIAANENTLIYN